MAASTTPPSTDTQPAPAPPLAASRRCIAVAYSGGRDSTALLFATARMAQALNEALACASALPEAPLQVLALHVHHGLSPHADDWLQHAQSQCQAWAAQGLPVTLAWRRLNLVPPAGASVEAVAREARYRALAEMAQEAGCDAVLLAHHRRDQAETFLLQALRRAGAAGLAAMPTQAHRHGVNWLRPWLEHTREQIEAYVAHHGLQYIEDDSNANPRFARNRLRLQVWPALTQAFEGVDEHLAQAAAHQADLKACLAEWRAEALPRVTRLRPGGLMLDVNAWLAQQPGPRRELLRGWFAQAAGAPLPLPGVRRLEGDLLRMAQGAGSGSGSQEGAAGRAARWPWPCPGPAPAPRELVLYRGLLRVRDIDMAETAPACTRTHELAIVSTGDVVLPEGLGVLRVWPVQQGGVALRTLARCRLQARTGGEQFQLMPGRPARSLKKQFQQQAVPAWARQGPLLFAGDQLVYVPGLGIDARVWAEAGEPQVNLSWHATQEHAEFGGNTALAEISDAKSGITG